ncbi:MAG: HAMP domain-containing histidine kinase [Phycisphaerales bacterium]|nr:MAG: HAMP domain-containing histidine kinase [Phycisphaerales bacterium]
MNVVTMNSTDTMIHTSSVGQTRLATFLESPEVRMLIHDLRHLVQAIVGSVDTLQIAMEEHAAGLTDKSLDRLKQNTNLAVDMLGHLVVDRQASDKEIAECNVAQEIDLIIDSLDSLLKQNGITINQEVSPRTIVEIRKADLNRLLLNLILNAVEATTKRDSPVTITAGAVSDGSVQITVQDDGCGIDKDKLANIFEEGYTTKTQRGNQGLGLAVVKQVLEVYGGAIRVMSQPGKGTEFTVCLPEARKNREGH